MENTRKEIRRLRKDMHAAKRDIEQMKSILERENRIDRLINEMKCSAREMLRISREI